MATSKITWEALRSRDAATLNGTFQTIGTPLAHAGYIVKMVNDSNSLVTVSIDGANAIDVCPAGSFWLYDEGKTWLSSTVPAIQKGTQFYVNGSVGSGLIYLVVQYVV